MADVVVYEANVRSLTARHPDVPPDQRGTYLGLAHPVVVDHLLDLGVTTVELLPVHQFTDSWALWSRGLHNLWGYDPIAWFAPHDRYASGDRGEQVREAKTMVRTLHDAGLEVIVDVVFNHTGEYDETGPAVCCRGWDDAGWYRHHADGSYEDTTGCRHSVDLRRRGAPRPGGRVAAVLGRRAARRRVPVRPGHDAAAGRPRRRPRRAVPRRGGGRPGAVAAQADRRAVGRRPRRLPRRRLPGAVVGVERPVPQHGAGHVARRDPDAAGPRHPAGRQPGPVRPGARPTASLNFVTAHDGFTLTDLVSYEHKRNEANGEDGRDGTDDNRSWNCGVEGPTSDGDVLALRERQRRNLLATLLVARGVPMLVAGDELGRTQLGNNNAYPQDNEVSWVDWVATDQSLLAFTRRMLATRRTHPELRGDAWLTDADVAWLRPDGAPMGPDDWTAPRPGARHGLRGRGRSPSTRAPRTAPSPCPTGSGGRWSIDTTTADGAPHPDAPTDLGGTTIPLPSRTVLVLAR